MLTVHDSETAGHQFATLQRHYSTPHWRNCHWCPIKIEWYSSQYKLSLALESRSFHTAKPYFWVIPGSSTIQHLSRNAFLHVIENNHYSDDVVKHNFTENGIPITNLISVSADGTPAMMGKHNEVLKLLRNGNWSMLAVNCIIHREFGICNHQLWTEPAIEKCYSCNKLD